MTKSFVWGGAEFVERENLTIADDIEVNTIAGRLSSDANMNDAFHRLLFAEIIVGFAVEGDAPFTVPSRSAKIRELREAYQDWLKMPRAYFRAWRTYLQERDDLRGANTDDDDEKN